MDHSYSKIIEVQPLKNKNHRQLEIVSLINSLNDVGGSHSEALGFSLEFLLNQGLAWVLLSWNIHIDRFPQFKEKIGIKTWVPQIKRCFAWREFLMVDSKNKKIGEASSQWLFYHILKKKPAKILPQLTSRLMDNSKETFLLPFMDFKIPKGSSSLDSERMITIQPEDIDILGHVHNSKYIEWMIKLKPYNVKQHYVLQNLQVHYHHEIKYPGEIIVKQYLVESGIEHQKTIYDVILNKKGQKISAEIITQWKDTG